MAFFNVIILAINVTVTFFLKFPAIGMTQDALEINYTHCKSKFLIKFHSEHGDSDFAEINVAFEVANLPYCLLPLMHSDKYLLSLCALLLCRAKSETLDSASLPVPFN